MSCPAGITQRFWIASGSLCLDGPAMIYISFVLGRLQAGTSYIQSSAWPFEHNENKVIYSGLAPDI